MIKICLIVATLWMSMQDLCAREIGAFPMGETLKKAMISRIQQKIKREEEARKRLEEAQAQAKIAAKEEKKNISNDLLVDEEKTEPVEPKEIQGDSKLETSLENGTKDKLEMSSSEQDSSKAVISERVERKMLQDGKDAITKDDIVKRNLSESKENIEGTLDKDASFVTNREKRLEERRAEIAKERESETSFFKKKAIENTEKREKKYEQVMERKELRASRFQQKTAEKLKEKREKKLKKQQERPVSLFRKKAQERAEARAKAREEKIKRLKRNKQKK